MILTAIFINSVLRHENVINNRLFASFCDFYHFYIRHFERYNIDFIYKLFSKIGI